MSAHNELRDAVENYVRSTTEQLTARYMGDEALSAYEKDTADRILAAIAPVFADLECEHMQQLSTVIAGRGAAEAQLVALKSALADAAISLYTISKQAGGTEELQTISQIRGYAFSRYSAALARK